MNGRSILLNPGPVTLTERVRTALTAGDWCHREAEFADLTRRINDRLAAAYASLVPAYRAVTLAGSGTAAVEGMLASFAPADRTTLVIANGVYGERMARMLAAHRKPCQLLEHEWTEAPDLAAIERLLDGEAAISHLAVVHHETTTGRLNDVAAIGRLCRARGITLLLDAVSSFGAEDIRGDEWNLGALAATANKCLHGVPGLSFVLAPVDRWETAAGSGQAVGSVYLDLYRYYEAQHRDGFSPFTLPVQVAFALDAALDEYAEGGGWTARRQLYRERAGRIHAVLDAAGVRTLLPIDDYSAVLWSYRLPPGRDYRQLHDTLKADGFIIYAGQGDLGREIFRIAHMGDIRPADLDRLCAALARVLGRDAAAGPAS